MQDKPAVERNWLMGVTTLALSLVLVGAGCAGSTDPNGAPLTGGTGTTAATANVDAVTFSSANITVDCPESGWTCSNQYGGEMSLNESVGIGQLTVVEMFSNVLDTAAKNQTERLVQSGGKLIDEDTEGDAKVAVLNYEDRNRMELIFFRKVGDKVFECKGTVQSDLLEGDVQGQIADACMSMRVAE